MARAPAHITRRTGIYIYRRRVPDDARDSGFFGGKSHYQVSLRTSDLNEAKARALPIGIRFDAEVANLRAGSVKAPVLKQGDHRVLTDEALESIQAKWFSAAIRQDRENHEIADADPGGEWSERMASDDDVSTESEELVIGYLIGVTFQQVQKYERGVNRIAGSKLILAADALKCDAADLLGNEREEVPGAQRLIRAWSTLTPEQREAVSVMVETFRR